MGGHFLLQTIKQIFWEGAPVCPGTFSRWGGSPQARGLVGKANVFVKSVCSHLLLSPVPLQLGGDEKVLETCLSLGGHRAPVVTVDWSTAMDCGTCLTASMDGKIKLTTLLAHKV